MKESATYQAMVSKGRTEGGRRILLRVARKKFGEPAPEIVARIEAIDDEAMIWALGDRLFEVSTWDELLNAR